MTMPRLGCGDDQWDGTIEPPCQNCRTYVGHGCECEPCADCKAPIPSRLNVGFDGKNRCAECQDTYLDANPKVCRERPAFTPSVAHLYAASWAMIARAGR